jgi:3-methyladenine DNA glycosylase AlkD
MPKATPRKTGGRKASPPRTKTAKRTEARDDRPIAQRVADVLSWLESHGSKRILDDMENRYNIRTTKAFGVSVGTIQQLAKQIGRDHDLAEALWQTGWYEARMLTSFIDEPERVTSSQMDRWARDFDNWAIVDTLCFNLFDRTPHAWRKVEQWSTKSGEFVKRAGFALLACLAIHDKQASNESLLRSLRLIEQGAADDRNFVKKGVSWALRTVGRRNRTLNGAAVETARRLVESSGPAARSVGKEALRELTSPAVQRRLRPA